MVGVVVLLGFGLVSWVLYHVLDAIRSLHTALANQNHDIITSLHAIRQTSAEIKDGITGQYGSVRSELAQLSNIYERLDKQGAVCSTLNSIEQAIRRLDHSLLTRLNER
jgi:hypothetical protein